MNDTGDKGHHKGVATLLGNPRKGIVKLAVPMIIAMSVNTLYNLFDAIWVAGLGPDGLAAVGFFFPVMMFSIAIATGIGIGAGAAISRKIGERNREGANQAAVQGLGITLIFSALLTVLYLVFDRQLFQLMGAGGVIDQALEYSRILFWGTVVIFFSNVGSSILRSEGSAVKSSLPMVIGAVLNIILDPVFIYGLKMGVAGAAWATLLAMVISSVMIFYFLFMEGKTYVKIKFRGFTFQKSVFSEIMRVGLPATISQMSMSIMMFIITQFLTIIAGDHGVSVFTTGWRVTMIAILPTLGIASAVIAMCGAAFGAREYGKMKTAFYYAIRFGLIIEVALALVTYFLAPYIASLFTWAEETRVIHHDLTEMIKILSLFYPAIPLGMFSASFFQGIGRGFASLVITIARTIVLVVPVTWFLGIYLGQGLTGIWNGMNISSAIACIISFSWVNITIRNLIAKGRFETRES